VRELREKIEDVIMTRLNAHLALNRSLDVTIHHQKDRSAHLALNQKRKFQFTAHLALRRPRFFPAILSAE
jgi:hypothetical protein